MCSSDLTEAKPRRKLTWQEKALIATRGTRFGAILACAAGREESGPAFRGKACITSDGFVTCDFIDGRGSYHHGAFVGAASDLDSNVSGLVRHLKLKESDAKALRRLVDSWIATDYRSRAALGCQRI